MNKLKLLHKKIRVCKKCDLWKRRTHVVPGEGPSNAKIMFIGEAPGRTEDESGRPFVGRAGKLLTELIESMEISRESVFITSIIKCRPPKNRKPKQKEIDTCLPYLHEQIEIIKPAVIVLLGNTAIKTVLNRREGVSKIHGQTIHLGGRTYFLTFHPAAGIRSTKRKEQLKSDFKRLNKMLKKYKIR